VLLEAAVLQTDCSCERHRSQTLVYSGSPSTACVDSANHIFWPHTHTHTHKHAPTGEQDTPNLDSKSAHIVVITQITVSLPDVMHNNTSFGFKQYSLKIAVNVKEYQSTTAKLHDL